MYPLLTEALEWLDRAEEAWRAADRLTDPEAKEVMLQLGRYFDRRARAVVERVQEGHRVLADRPDRLN